MRREPNQADCQKILTKISKLIIVEIEQQVKGNKEKKIALSNWESACLMVAWFGEGNDNGWQSKLRVMGQDGNQISIQTTYEIDELTQKIGDIKDKAYADDKWYGLKLTVYPNKKTNVDLEHNTNSAQDPIWYKS